MKVSIITVTFNAGSFLENTLNSIFAQSYPDIECIVIDGNSSDNTLSILEKYQNKIKFISEPDSGIYDAMNKGIGLATGDIIGILNSDDMLYSNDTIEKIANSFSLNIDCIYGNVVIVNKSDNIIRNYNSSKFILSDFEFGHMPAHPSFYVRREVFRDLGVYNTSFRISSDFDLLLRYLYIHKINSKYINLNIVKMRDGGISSSFKNKWLLNKEILFSCREHKVNTNLFKIYSKYLFKWRSYISILNR